MNTNKGPFNPQILLWWIAIIALGVSAAFYFFMADQAQYDPALHQRRSLVVLVGTIIAGVCIISGTAGRWFQSK
ncbi:MAG: hypothetical protein OEL75_03585 [Kiritimatiellaceae bacterium]|nr:hypothetical protein [Kiritimatiellaceae bacterium]